MLTTSDIAEKVRNLLAAELKVGADAVQPEKRIADDLGADSLQRVELVMKLEEAFGIKIPDEDAEALRTVQDVIEYVQKHLNS